jgi:prepilin-type processing-associated H-X9-DG protein
MFVDGNDHNIGSMEGANYHKYWDRTGATDGRNGGAWWVVAYRHLEGANIVHFDGHGDYYPKEEAWPEDEVKRERLWRPYDTDVYRPGR